MRGTGVLAALALTGMVAFPAAVPASEGHGSGEVHWGYTGETGPSHWGSLKDEFIACEIGKNQSPIDIQGAVKAALDPIRFDYGSEPLEVLNNGHTIQVQRGAGGIVVDGQEFRLLQFHFHGPSEHTIEGQPFPMEMHLVHKSADGHLAVVGVMLKEGANNEALDAVWGHLPEHAGAHDRVEAVAVNVDDLLPKDRAYFHYSGSLTTPPCSEGVRWYVLKTPVEVSREQIERFGEVMADNNRPVQPHHARKVLTSF